MIKQDIADQILQSLKLAGFNDKVSLHQDELDKAEEIGGMQNDILVNRGIIAAIKGELDRAQKLFNQGGL